MNNKKNDIKVQPCYQIARLNLADRGFTIFFAMLAASLALSVGLAIYDLTSREIDLSAAATQSQYAIYAADTGVECALYWDAKYTNVSNNNNGGSGSAFATSSLDAQAPASLASLSCNGEDISTQGPPALDLTRYGASASSPWYVQTSSSQATTTFFINIPSGSIGTYCAVVQIAKATQGNVLSTTVVSRGYNTCTAGLTRYERTLQVNY